jgi:predicted DNA-binding transcriptional regulator AlpA
MAKRKPDPALVGQMDMFGDIVTGVETSVGSILLDEVPENTSQPKPANDALETPVCANDARSEPFGEAVVEDIVTEVISQEGDLAVQRPSRVPLHQTGTSPVWLDDEWWTTAMVCGYLKLGRKAIWERQRDPECNFPKTVHFGSMRQRWRSEEVRAWARASDS